jgi:uncharacterized membrane protein YtjA (UPF0391 family)
MGRVALLHYSAGLLDERPNEQAPVHWESRHLLPFNVCIAYTAWEHEIQVRADSWAFHPGLASVQHRNLKGGIMLYWTIVFLVVALIAGILGFTGVAIAAASLAKLLFVVFLALFLFSLIGHLSRRGV